MGAEVARLQDLDGLAVVVGPDGMPWVKDEGSVGNGACFAVGPATTLEQGIAPDVPYAAELQAAAAGIDPAQAAGGVLVSRLCS